MPYTLTQPQKQYIKRLVKLGKFNNESEVVRAAVRLLEERESAYLNPPPLPPGTMEKIYARQSKEENEREARAVKSLTKARAHSLRGKSAEEV